MTDDQIKHMAQRFLGWKLPQPFRPDAGISFEPEYNVEYNAKHGRPPNRHEPTGTNLWGYTEAVEMVRHMVEGLAVDQDAIERHEAFKKEVSEAVRKVLAHHSENYCADGNTVSTHLRRFIIEPPVDPIKECLAVAYGSAPEEFVGAFKEALAKRGLQIIGATP